MSQQLAIAALASTLSLAALALSSDGLTMSGNGGASLLPSVAKMPEASFPTLPTLLPR